MKITVRTVRDILDLDPGLLDPFLHQLRHAHMMHHGWSSPNNPHVPVQLDRDVVVFDPQEPIQ